jgi:hypothetical protein
MSTINYMHAYAYASLYYFKKKTQTSMSGDNEEHATG